MKAKKASLKGVFVGSVGENESKHGIFWSFDDNYQQSSRIASIPETAQTKNVQKNNNHNNDDDQVQYI